MNLRQRTKDEFYNVLDCMTGADGGVRFMQLKVALERYDAEAEGNESSAEVMMILSKFSALIDLVQTGQNPVFYPDPLDPPFQFEPEEDDGSDEVIGEEEQT